jgi:hypothetical protein
MPTSSRWPQFVACLSGLAACLVLVGCGSGGGGSFTKENYQKVQNGMAEGEVTKLLGAPTETKSVGPAKMMVWKSGNDMAQVTFTDGKVAMKMSSYEIGDMFKGKFPQ